MRACSRKESAHKDIAIFIQYLQQLTYATLDILKTFIIPIFEECKEECINIIEHSFITHSFLPAITILSGILYTDLFKKTAKKLWADLVQILKYLDHICSLDDALLSASSSIMDASDQLSAENTKYVETPHSYPPNTKDVKRIHIPGATHLCITFDSKCHTDSRDQLELLLGNGVPICGSLHGHKWPQTSLIIPGNEVVFKFESKSNDTHRNWWGYGALVTGLKFGIFPQCSVFLDLFHTTSHIVGKCLRSVMVGKACNEQEIAHRKWLASPLFSKGRELDDKGEDEDYDSDDPHQRNPRKKSADPNLNTDQEDGKDDEKQGISVIKDIIKPSPRWSPLVKHQEFLEDLASLKPKSKASAFQKKMFAQCKKSICDTKGGEVVDDTINCVIAAMLKHLGLVEIARKCAHDYESTPKQLKAEWNDKLLFVFKKAKDLRTWIANEKSRHQRDHEALLTEVKEKEKHQDENAAANKKTEALILKTSRWTSYEGICSEIKTKAEFLLKMRPFCKMFMEGISDEADTTSFSMTVQVSQLKSLERQVSDGSLHGNTKANSLDQWKLAFNTWKTINTFEAHKAQKKHDKSQITSLPDMILSFIQCETSLESFISLIKRHRRRAKLRSESMECLLKLVRDELKCLSPKVTLLREWKCPLREYGDYDGGPRTIHFLSNIQSCGELHEKKIRSNWEKLYSYLTDLIKNAETPLPLKQQAISAWAVVLSPGEEFFISSTKILDTIHSMLSQYIALQKANWSLDEGDKDKDMITSFVGLDWKALAPQQKDNNKRLLQSLYNLLGLMLMRFNNGNKRQWASMPTPNDLNLDGLQVQILNSTHCEIIDNIERLNVIKLASHRNAKIHIAEEDNDWDSVSADIRFICANYDATFLEIESLIYSHIACIR
eukprot:262779_1